MLIMLLKIHPWKNATSRIDVKIWTEIDTFPIALLQIHTAHLLTSYLFISCSLIFLISRFLISSASSSFYVTIKSIVGSRLTNLLTLGQIIFKFCDEMSKVCKLSVYLY